MEMSRFCWGIKLFSAVRCLAIHGMVMSVLGMIGGAILLALPFLIRIEQSVIFGTAAFLLSVNFWRFFFSYFLNKTINNDEVQDMKNLIRIGCYAIGFVEMLVIVVGFFIGTSIFGLWNNPLFSLLILFGGIWLIPLSLFIHGIRTRNPARIKPWIEFQLLIFPLISLLGLVCCILFGTPWRTIPLLLLVFAEFLYQTGLAIVHYNIILEVQPLESALQNFSNEHPGSSDMNEDITDLPPPYSSIALYPTMV